jgi:effector-binding domain-containing protein
LASIPASRSQANLKLGGDDCAMDYDISVRDLPAQPIVVVEGDISMAEIGPFLGGAFPQVAAAHSAAGAAPSGPPLARYDMQGDRLLVEAGFPVAVPCELPEGDVVCRIIEAGSVATTTHTGPFDQIPGAYAALSQWITAHGYAPSGRPWEQYLSVPQSPQQLCTVSWPCVRA